MSAMDLDYSLDDLIKQKRNSKIRGNVQRQNRGLENQQRNDNRVNIKLQTKAKINKVTPRSPKNGKINIISRLSIVSKSNSSVSLYTNPTAKTDPSQIIITKAIPAQSIQRRLDLTSQKNTNKQIYLKNTKDAEKPSNLIINRLISRQDQPIPTRQKIQKITTKGHSSISICGRANKALPSHAFSINDDSGPTTILISGLDCGTNSEDLRVVCEGFGQVLRCEVLRNRMGESFGEAEVEFSKKNAAFDCIARLDNAKADGQYLRVIIRDNKPKPRGFTPSQISTIISVVPSNKAKTQQSKPKYGTIRR